MFEDRTDIRDFAKTALDRIVKASEARLIALRKARNLEPLAFPDLEEVCGACWEEFWEGALGRLLMTDISEAERKLFPELRETIVMSFLNFCMRPSAVVSEHPEGLGWVTDEVRRARRYWPLLKRRLESKYPAATVASIDEDSERILAQLHDPKDEAEWKTYGLVVGQVQSGKTANYTALINKAADAGYRVIIVLSGIHNDLREQTQKRLDEEFVGFHQKLPKSDEGTSEVTMCGVSDYPEYSTEFAPQSGTYLDSDFRGCQVAMETRPWLFVIKKQRDVFTKLLKWIKAKVPNRERRPLLLIDDEADQASINTKKNQELTTVTNKAIREILALFPRVAFVGYTATPFANVFINAKAETDRLGRDLFPRDFIYPLRVAPNYFGPKQFFGDNEDAGLGLCMLIDEKSVSDWWGSGRIQNRKTGGERKSKVISDKVPPEARQVFLQFLLSTAIRLWRRERRFGFEGEDGEVKPLESSMLVHVSHRVSDQQRLGKQFRDIAEEVRKEAHFCGLTTKSWVKDGLEALFVEQCTETTPSVKAMRSRCDAEVDWSLPESFEAFRPLILEVIDDLEIRLVNGEATSKMDLVLEPEPTDDYLQERRTKTVLFVGGNKLSRGLTLPGLCVSLFLRGTTMYDTLMQMGRWFGYRDGYVDLCRIATTASILSAFRTVTTASEDFLTQVSGMQNAGRTPENYRLKILTHPGLLATARNKMYTADQGQVNFAGFVSEERTFSFKESSKGLSVEERTLQPALRFYDAVRERGRLVYWDRSYDPDYAERYGEPRETELAGRERPRHSSGRLWRGVPTSDVVKFLNEFDATGEHNRSRTGLIKFLEPLEERGELVDWNVFIPGKYNPGAPFDLEPSVRSSLSTRTGGEVVVRAMKAGEHEFAGVPAELMDRVRESSSQYVESGEFFEAVRKAAGDAETGTPRTGYLILYVMKLVDKSGKEIGDFTTPQRPLASYYLWIPAGSRYHGMSMAAFNSTVSDWDDEEDEFDDDDEE